MRESIRNDITVIIRTVGERTLNLCIEMAKIQVPENHIHVINETPFTKALYETYRIGIKDNRKWTFVVDADVLLVNNSILGLVSIAEKMEDNLFEIEGKIVDKFLHSPREAGNHLYRTKYLKQAIEFIPDPFLAIRPETHVKDAMKSAGHPWKVVDMVVGIHDFEQTYKDIYRKSYIQAKKHYEIVKGLEGLWKHLAELDDDFKVALKGFQAGETEKTQVSIDAKSEYLNNFEEKLLALGLKEKSDITRDISFVYLEVMMHLSNVLKYSDKRKILTNNELIIRNSRDYRLGNFILSPLRFLKRYLTVGRR